MRRIGLAAAALLILVSACHAGPAVIFRGRGATPSRPPDAIVELAALPRGADRLGRVWAQCTLAADWEGFQGLSLAEVDCTERRVRQMLREAASQFGGDVLSGVQCQGSRKRTCQATLGRIGADSDSADKLPSAGPDLGGQRGSEIEIDFMPLVRVPPRSPRAESNLREHSFLTPGYRTIGSFVVRCQDCTELEGREALRIAVAGFGAPDLVGVQCQAWGAGVRCLGAAADVTP